MAQSENFAASSEQRLENINLHTTTDLKELRGVVSAIITNLQREGQPKTRYRELVITRLTESNLWLMMAIHDPQEQVTP